MESLAVAILLVICFVASADAFTTMGAYDLVFRKLEHCPDQGTGEFIFSNKMTKRSKYLYTYTEDLTLPCPWDETLDAFITVKKKVSGQWSAEVFRYNATNCCEVLRREIPEDFKTVAKYLGAEESCPLPCGEFKNHNWDVVMQELPMKKMVYGEYQGDLSLYRHGVLLGCARIYMDVVPKN